jgi:hypothetical protein
MGSAYKRSASDRFFHAIAGVYHVALSTRRDFNDLSDNREYAGAAYG